MISHTRQLLRKKRRIYTLIGVGLLVLLASGLYFVPPIRLRVDNRLDTLRTQIKYLINPPENVVFFPTEKSQQTSTPAATATATRTPLPDLPTAAPTITSTPLPTAVKLTGIVYASQCNRWNYCGPANLSMALKYWGWKGESGNSNDLRDQIAAVIKPGENDPNKNFIDRGRSDLAIMPYEMVDFVNNHTSSRALYRYGGNVELLQRMIAAGFPVIVEKGYYQRESGSSRISWMGHFSFITGYDETQKQFVWQDSYPNRCADMDNPSLVEKEGLNNLISYDDLVSEWRSYNYLFIVIYPPEHEADVMQALGPWADAQWSAQHALDVAHTETVIMTGNDQFFAWFNVGTSNVALQEYTDAASAYDQAFTMYSELPNEDPQRPNYILRPYRILWYETGPYWAYFYTGRYQDVINLATSTLNAPSEPSLEESLYWRAMAEYALGQYDAAYADIRNAVYYNKNMQVALARMQEWGISP
jgi:tetratricopeptide (TPR) repeat protein